MAIRLIRIALAAAVVVAAAAGAHAFWSTGVRGMISVPEGSAILGYVYYTGLYGPMPYQVQSFKIDEFEVTNADYTAFTKATGHSQPAFHDDEDFNRPDQPVTGVLHSDAIAYCTWAGKRLPNEVEWEKAARGSDGGIYPWGEEADLSRAHLTGEFPADVNEHAGDISPFGVRGMAGNVSEWVSDIRQARAGVCHDDQSMPQDLPKEMQNILAELTAANGGVLPELCVAPEMADQSTPSEPCAFIKGNSWNGRPHMTVASNRMWDYTNTYAEFVGFRCAKDG